jgi:hypothetical protein
MAAAFGMAGLIFGYAVVELKIWPYRQRECRVALAVVRTVKQPFAAVKPELLRIIDKKITEKMPSITGLIIENGCVFIRLSLRQ